MKTISNSYFDWIDELDEKQSFKTYLEKNYFSDDCEKDANDLLEDVAFESFMATCYCSVLDRRLRDVEKVLHIKWENELSEVVPSIRSSEGKKSKKANKKEDTSNGSI